MLLSRSSFLSYLAYQALNLTHPQFDAWLEKDHFRAWRYLSQRHQVVASWLWVGNVCARACEGVVDSELLPEITVGGAAD